MGSTRNRAIAGAAVVAAAPALLFSCSPNLGEGLGFGMINGPAEQPVAIGIDPTSAEQVVVGEIYAQIFNAMGYAVGVSSIATASTDPIDLLRTERVDVVIACTGELLRIEDPVAAEEVEMSGLEGEELSVATYDAMVGTFPSDIRTVDPSPAHGCAPVDDEGISAKSAKKAGGKSDAKARDKDEQEAADPLPQNIVPLFTDGRFDRGTTRRINFITRVMATDDIAEAAAEVRKGVPVEDAVADWLLEYAHIAVNPSGEVEVAPEIEEH